MELSIKNMITLLNASQSDWLKVNEELCVHRYFDNYYILLCHWFDPELKSNVIYLEVDDLDQKKENILKGTYQSESEEYNLLYPIYKIAYSTSKAAKRYKAS